MIPAKANRVDPEPLDRAAYRERNRVERLFAKLKEFRRVATRYEKLKETFLGMIHLALGFIRLRAKTNISARRGSPPIVPIVRHYRHQMRGLPPVTATVAPAM